MVRSPAYFEKSDAGYVPLAASIGPWAPGMVAGGAVCGLVAHVLDIERGRDGFVPARLTVDMFRPVRSEPLTVVTSIVRDGNRIRAVDAEIVQESTVVVRATAILLAASDNPPGERWTPDRVPQAPVDELHDGAGPDDREPVWFSSGDAPGAWSATAGDHQDARRKRLWQRAIPVVAGEPTTPFGRAAMIAEVTSFLTNLGTGGIGFINADLTVAIARMPIGPEVGAEADNHIASAGVSVGTATLFDRTGIFGSATVTALANQRRAVSFVDESKGGSS